jgi:nickel transport protein
MPTLPSLVRSALCGLALLAGAAQAHNVWLEPDARGGYLIQFGGHAGQLEAFDPAKLQSVRAFDRRGRGVEARVEQAPQSQGLRVVPSPEAALIAVELDNGFFSGPAGGAMRNVPMDRNPGATRGVHARKFHKTVVVWNALTQRELGQDFEVTPRQGRAPHAGEMLVLQVRLQGQPLAGASVRLGENGPVAMTDAKGLASIQAVRGSNHVQVIFRQPVQGVPRVTENSYEALFSFAAH